ncbi:MAG TPA: DNA alkylation repair protein, partial [Gemmataceae bacterium]|nr:DNA alkylation repair protein [Gemmataceae bacterium]
MTAAEIVSQLKSLGLESYKKVLRNHGIKEPFFGVKIEEMKKIQKKVKKDYQLALDLYDTGIYDAMYLAGLIADDLKMTKRDLQHWVETANCAALCGFTVAWVAAESNHGREMALKWIESKNEQVAAAGWSTFCSLVA